LSTLGSATRTLETHGVQTTGSMSEAPSLVNTKCRAPPARSSSKTRAPGTPTPTTIRRNHVQRWFCATLHGGSPSRTSAIRASANACVLSPLAAFPFDIARGRYHPQDTMQDHSLARRLRSYAAAGADALPALGARAGLRIGLASTLWG
jgi:hypothetical protein